jgi:hypothetical protein
MVNRQVVDPHVRQVAADAFSDAVASEQPATDTASAVHRSRTQPPRMDNLELGC